MTLDFYNLAALLITLVLIKLSLSQSGTNRFLTIFGNMLTFSIFDNFFSFLPTFFYLFRQQMEVPFSKDPGNKVDTSSKPPSPGEWMCNSPSEQGTHYCIEKTKYWANLGGCSAALFVTSQIVLGLLRRLKYTQMLVKKLTDRGYPKWLFYLLDSSTPKDSSEKNIFDSMVYILVINFLILFMLFSCF